MINECRTPLLVISSIGIAVLLLCFLEIPAGNLTVKDIESSKITFAVGSIYQYFYRDSSSADSPTHEDVGEHCEKHDWNYLETKLKEVLMKHAEEAAGIITPPIKLKRQINPLPLQLSKSLRVRSLDNLYDEGHFNRREELLKVSVPQDGDVSLDELFAVAKEKAKEHAKYQTKNELSRRKSIEQQKNIVTLVGQAGIGKTTLTKMIVQKILNKTFLSDCEYIFFLPIRRMNFKLETNFLKFALTGISSNWKHSPQTDEVLLENLHNNSNVLFIFDDLDEADGGKFSKSDSAVNLFDSHTADAFLKNIFSGYLFSKAKKVITSRPRQFYELHPTYRPHFVVDILGLNKVSQDNLCEQVCGRNCSKVKEYLINHPEISSSCYVPAKCIIILAVLSRNINKNDEFEVKSLTDVFVQALGYYVRSEVLKTKGAEAWKLAELAWNGFINRKIIFDEQDFESINISREAFEAFLVTFTIGEIDYAILKEDKKSYFAHLIWQELFAAIYAMMCLPLDEFEEYVPDFDKSNWQVVTKFMYGLSDASVKTGVKNILNFQLFSEKMWKNKTVILQKYAVYLMEQEGKQIRHDGVVDWRWEINYKGRKLLHISEWVHEMQNDDFAKAIASHLPNKLSLTESFLPSDASSLIYLLNRKENATEFIVENSVKFVQDSYFRLMKGLSTLPIKSEEIHSMANCIKNTEVLSFSYCNLTDDDVSIISSTIASLKYPLKHLEFSYGNIGDKGVIGLANAIHNIDGLKFGYMSSVGIEAMARKISTRQTQMNRLHLQCIILTKEAVTALADSIHRILSLHFVNSNLSSEGVKIIARKICLRSTPMDTVNLSWNKFGDEGAIALAACLHNIKILNLRGCGISEVGIKAINEKIMQLPEPMPLVKNIEWQHTSATFLKRTVPSFIKSLVLSKRLPQRCMLARYFFLAFLLLY